MGDVILKKPLTKKQLAGLSGQLRQLGFELLDDKRKQQIDKIKPIIIEHIHYQEDEKFPFREVLAKELKREYSAISKLFSKTEGVMLYKMLSTRQHTFLFIPSIYQQAVPSGMFFQIMLDV